jgi:hypothetical protein
VTTTYAGMLTTDSEMYCRTNCLTSSFYFHAIQVDVLTSGTYNFVSSSTMDTYGYIYSNSFHPSNPNRNLLSENDDGSGNRQFEITGFLHRMITYVLVVTTFDRNSTGTFLVVVSGATAVTLTRTIILLPSKMSNTPLRMSV